MSDGDLTDLTDLTEPGGVGVAGGVLRDRLLGAWRGKGRDHGRPFGTIPSLGARLAKLSLAPDSS